MSLILSCEKALNDLIRIRRKMALQCLVCLPNVSVKTESMQVEILGRKI